MSTAQAVRRRRGRAIRKQRRIRAARPNRYLGSFSFSEMYELVREAVEAIHRALQNAARFAFEFTFVAGMRMSPVLGATAHRQLLHNGRAPRRGRR